ncbi:DNA (cytosine-5-)-methyltransferase [Desulfitobacterium hafniense DP7]|uniref:site-specific DNA-methyltransferase (adenine-specific) n=1 Tax=Desulfitobacterium hafniense DP7 TaxID=537010 RepID=G9XTS5_DESHA|nr:DNA adenine methylase [Desulfitobacterium hafniense]EHL04970.1 DNA (cytosine-5-)-methyltransferase [Desulfitobacterium hafniense DP7]
MIVQQSFFDAEKVDDIKMNEWESVSTIQYLGSKTRILADICPEICKIEGIDTFVDLFAGTGTVAYALRNKFKIYANDLQSYSKVISEAVLNGADFNELEADCLFKNIQKIYDELVNTIGSAIQKEQDLFEQTVQNTDEYKLFCEETPSVFCSSTNLNVFESLNNLCRKVKVGNSQQDIQLPVLFITYYANTYFGIRQCCEIDAIRGAISQVEDRSKQYVLLTSLMSVMSSAVSATTHFAQFLKIRDKVTATNLMQKRQVSIIELFKIKLIEFKDKGMLVRNEKEAVCANQDYLDFLNSIPLGPNTLVYADPPYFKEHYSRYYHILETLFLYDYPRITYNTRLNDYTVGRYREDRAVSPFGKKSFALKAFERLFETCAISSAHIAISYSDNSIVKVDDIIELAEKWYKVEVKEIPLKHSNQGRASISEVNEILIIGKPNLIHPGPGRTLVEKLFKSIEDIAPLYDNPAAAMHNYMARKPYNIVNKIIDVLLPNKGVVFDPFCGSGTTLIEGRKLGHSTVGVDINQQATLITKSSLKKWDINVVEELLNNFGRDVESQLSDIYEIKIKEEKRIIERCHFDLIEDKLVPTSYWYKALRKDGTLGPRKKDYADIDFLNQYNQYEMNALGLFENYRLIPNSRIAVTEGATVSDYLCPRNRIAVDRLINILYKYENSYAAILCELVFSSALNLIKLSDKKASSQIPYWRPKYDLTSRNAYWIIKDKIEIIIDGLKYLQKEAPGDIVESFNDVLLPGSNSLIIRSPIQDLSENALPNNSIDLVVTDPPYTDQVPYLEYSQLWSLLLNWDNLNPELLKEEIVVSNANCRKEKTHENFSQILALMFIRVSKAMKQHSHMVIFFHDFSLKAWSNIIRAAENAGLAYQGQVSVGRQRRSFKTVLSPNRTLDGNYLIVFRKIGFNPPTFNGDINAAVERCVMVAKSIIRDLGGKATSQDLYDKGLLRDSIESGSLHLLAEKYKTFLNVFKSSLKFDNGYWSEE